MSAQTGGTLLAERPSALIAEVLGSTSGLTWGRCELPVEAATCPVAWCHGIHALPDYSEEDWIIHERDIAQATRNGELVLEVSVHRVVPVRPGSLTDTGDSFAINTARRPQIFIHLYKTGPSVFRGYWLEDWRHFNGFGTILRLLGEHEFAGAIAAAADLCQEIEGASR